MTFKEFNLDERLEEAIDYMGFTEATPVQVQAIPQILDGKDLICCAQTGTGKTAAFILPILNKLAQEDYPDTDTLVIVPTRELAVQIHQAIQGFSYFVPVGSLAIYGGGDGSEWEQEKIALTQGNSIIVATPGKLIAHLRMGYVKFNNIRHLILDEADRMLDMGFYEDIQKIISHLPKKRQTLMFSATMPPKIRELAKKALVDPGEINIAMSKPAEGVLQAAYLAYDEQKIPLIHSLIADKPEYQSILIFSATKKSVSEINKSLKKKNFSVEKISSDLEQREREEVLGKFKAKQVRILVATDVLSRGIDIKDISLIINYNVPADAEDYVHRVGRTARASSTGVALTLVDREDMYRLKRIEELIGSEIHKLPVPHELGDGPEWNPVYFSKKPTFKKKSGKKGKFKKK
ncbi:MAG TPA: DEAD/DEAH box helicase [Bacteroides sp.]|nr:DEAD/DEAH box helicase [Bacteroides sp.]